MLFRSMAFHAQLCRKLSQLLICAARGESETMEARWQEIHAYVCDNEPRFQREFDAFEFFNVWENKILFRFRQRAEASIE